MGLSHFGSGYGISQLHPSGYSAQHITRLHKREAEAEPEADAYYGYDTVSDTDTVWDTDMVWDTVVWDTPMVDTMAMDTVMDMDTATMDKPGACAIYFLFK